jgi:hypothetical protein
MLIDWLDRARVRFQNQFKPNPYETSTAQGHWNIYTKKQLSRDQLKKKRKAQRQARRGK